MKKYLALLVAVLLVVTGCGTKKLECTGNISGLKQDVVIEYKGEDIKSLEMDMSYDKDTLEGMGITSDLLDTFISSMDAQVCPVYEAYEGVTCSTSEQNGGIRILITMDYGKLTQEAKDELSMNYQSYDSTKKDLEAAGYTCK